MARSAGALIKETNCAKESLGNLECAVLIVYGVCSLCLG